MFIAANHCGKPSVHTVASPKSKRSPPTLTRVCRLHRWSCSFTQPPFPRKEKHLVIGNGLPRQCSRKGEQHVNIGIWVCPLSVTVLLGMVCSHRELQASSIHLIVFVSILDLDMSFLRKFIDAANLFRLLSNFLIQRLFSIFLDGYKLDVYARELILYYLFSCTLW
jgi:hypothetical protein